MKPEKIKILESAFSAYSGYLFGVEFKNGVSVCELPYIDQQRICAIMKAETLDGENVSTASSLAKNRELKADTALEMEVEAEPVVELKRESEKIDVTYSREELEAIADKGGIAGLRLIGNDLDVREKSIELMIEKILNVAGGA
uniref:Uncharacterized protein n=1 Tax=Pectobacterium carotovorum TaxID=554 RepID=A0A0K0MPW1_PECCA|nr:hypothetical protein [Pectobacterium carotovorum]AKG47469.1 hypothetical protein pA_00029 [Pectobacterium carotovorum]